MNIIKVYATDFWKDDSALLNSLRSYNGKPPRVCAKTLEAILSYHLFFVYLWKETKQYIYELHSGRKRKSNSNDSS